MPIEHDTIGRKYTGRRIIRQVGEPTEVDRQEAQAALDRLREAALSPHRNSNAVCAWATAQLEKSGLPSGRDELNGSPYDQEDWERDNKRYESLDWYAHKLLLSVLVARAWYDRGEYERAMDECVALGYLHREAQQVAREVGKQSKAGSLPKQLSEKRQEWRDRKARWREEAPGWWTKKPHLSATDVAKRIDPRHEQACRKAIADLNPNRVQRQQK